MEKASLGGSNGASHVSTDRRWPVSVVGVEVDVGDPGGAGGEQLGDGHRAVVVPFCISRSTSTGCEDQVLPQSRSDGAVMDVAPKGAWTAALQWTGDGVVGFFVVGFGVLVW